MTVPIESRFRITICFPLGQHAAYYQTLNWLTKRLKGKQGGVTLTIHQPLPVMRGFYFSEELRKAVTDRVVYIFADAGISQDREVEDLEKFLRRLKKALHRRIPQEEEFWIAYHPITRIVQPTKEESLTR